MYILVYSNHINLVNITYFFIFLSIPHVAHCATGVWKFNYPPFSGEIWTIKFKKKKVKESASILLLDALETEDVMSLFLEGSNFITF